MVRVVILGMSWQRTPKQPRLFNLIVGFSVSSGVLPRSAVNWQIQSVMSLLPQSSVRLPRYAVLRESRFLSIFKQRQQSTWSVSVCLRNTISSHNNLSPMDISFSVS